MNAQLDPVVAALADLSDPELGALIAMVDDGPQLASTLFAWIEHVCDWELNRRQGLDFPFQSREAATEPEQIPTSIVALAVVRAQFVQDDPREVVTALFGAMLGLLTGGDRRH